MKDSKPILNFLKPSVCLWSAAAIYSYYPVANLFSVHAMLLSVLILTLVFSYIEAAYARVCGGEKKKMHVTNHKFGMIISLIFSYIGAALMVKRRFDQGKGFLFQDRDPTYHSTLGLTWLVIASISSSSGWLVHKEAKSLDTVSIFIFKFIGKGNVKVGQRRLKNYHRYGSFAAVTLAFVAVGFGLHKSKRVMLSYSLVPIYIFMWLIF